MKNQEILYLSQMMQRSIRLFVVILFTILASLYASGQSKKSGGVNAVNIELGGNGFFYSVSYERIIQHKANLYSAFSIGFGVVKFNDLDVDELAFHIPFQYNLLCGRGNHHLELGLGYTFRKIFQFDDFYEYPKHFIPVRVGYRYQKFSGGLYFRAALTPVYGVEQDFDPRIYPMLGISIGYVFKTKPKSSCD